MSGPRDLPPDFVERLWAKDASLWSDDPDVQASIRYRLGWLDIAATMRPQLAELEAFAKEVRGAGYQRVMVLGMGGSVLGVEYLRTAFGVDEYAEPVVPVRGCGSTVPADLRRATEWTHEAKTLFFVSSKSGTTRETLAFYRHFREAHRSGEHFTAITDPHTPLAALAEAEGFRRCLFAPADVGGRFSLFTPFGLAPAAIGHRTGALGRLLDAVERVAEQCRTPDPATNPGLALGLALTGAPGHTRSLYDYSGWGDQAAWVEQLLAESTGKEGRGLVPGTWEGTDVLPGRGGFNLRPHLIAESPGAEDWFALRAVTWMVATAVAGARLGVNPFDQPDVELAKQRTDAMLAAGAGRPAPLLAAPAADLFADPALAASGPFGTPGDVYRAHWARRSDRDEYAAFLSYLPGGPAAVAAAQAPLREIGAAHRGYTYDGLAALQCPGPAYLHSTGQLHKGGPDVGLYFLTTTDDPDPPLPVPGEAYGFQELALAQAAGDFQALAERGRRVVWTHRKLP